MITQMAIVFSLKVCEGKNFALSQSGTNKPKYYITANLKGDPSESTLHTDIIEITGNEVGNLTWNKEFQFNCPNPSTDLILVNMFKTFKSKPSSSDDSRIIDPIHFNVKNFPTDDRRIWSEDVKLKKKIVGHLKFEIETKQMKTVCPQESDESVSASVSTGDTQIEKKIYIKRRSTDFSNFWPTILSFTPTYRIYARIESGENLLIPKNSVTGNSTSDIYVVCQVEGSNLVATSQLINSTPNPVWNDVLKMNGYCIGSDLLHIWVYITNNNNNNDSNEKSNNNNNSNNDSNNENTKNNENNQKGYNDFEEKDINNINYGKKERKSSSFNIDNIMKDNCIGYTRVFINDLNLGDVQTIEGALFKVKPNSNSIASQDSKPGEAGKLNLAFHIAQMDDLPFIVKSWNCPFFQAWIEIQGFDTFPPPVVIDGNTARSVKPYLTAKIVPAANCQRQRTRILKESNNSSWNEKFVFLLDNYSMQSLIIHLFYESKEGGREDDISICKAEIPLTNYKISEMIEDSVQMKGKKLKDKIKVNFRLKIVAKGNFPFDEMALKNKENNENKSIKENQSNKDSKIVSIKKKKNKDKNIEQYDNENINGRNKENKKKILNGRNDDKNNRNMYDSSEEKENSSFTISSDFFGSYDSCYSTSFDGYTNNSRTLSSFSSTEITKCHRKEPEQEAEELVKVYSFSGKIANIKMNLGKKIKNIFFAIQTISKTLKKREVIETKPILLDNTKAQGIELNESFSFSKVKKGYMIEIITFNQKNKNIIGSTKFHLTEIEPNSIQTKCFEIRDIYNENCGEISVVIDYNINYK